MIIEIGNIDLFFPNWMIIVVSFLLSFSLTYIVIPSIIRVSKEKGLFDQPDPRKSHTLLIPTLGGSAVFIGMIIPTVLYGDLNFEHDLKYIICCLLILFFIGIKDDILIISPRTKLIAEIFAIVIIVILGDMRVTSFHGFLGLKEIPYFVSIVFTIFMFVVIINGYNLIDGIDGLAAGVGIITISSFGAWHLLIRDYSYAAFCFSSIGALLAFFLYNVFGKKNKIFLGDTGSLIIGLIITIFTIRFLESSLSERVASIYLSAPAIAIGILIVPLIDTLRVFTIRIFIGKSPFSPDRFHIHHQLLSLGFNHLKSTLIILAFNLMIIIISFSLRHLGNIKLVLFIVPLSAVITSLPGFFIRYRDRGLLKKLDLLGEKSWIVPNTFTHLVVTRKSHTGKHRKSNHSEINLSPPVRVEKELESVTDP